MSEELPLLPFQIVDMCEQEVTQAHVSDKYKLKVTEFVRDKIAA